MTAALSVSQQLGLAVDALRDAVAELAELNADTAPAGPVVLVGMAGMAHNAAQLATRLTHELTDLAAAKLGGPGLYVVDQLQLRVTVSQRARCYDVAVSTVTPEGAA